MTGPQLLEGDCWERGGDFFSGGGVQLSHNKLKPQIFNDKKSLWAKIFFFVITNNSNWEVLPKTLVTFKRQDGIVDEKLLGVHWKIQLLGEWGSRKTNKEGGLPKKGGIGQFADLRGGELGKKEGVVF